MYLVPGNFRLRQSIHDTLQSYRLATFLALVDVLHFSLVHVGVDEVRFHRLCDINK